MGLRAIVYYFSTTFFAIILGIVLVVSIHPGDKSFKEGIKLEKDDAKPPTSLDAFLDLIRCVPLPLGRWVVGRWGHILRRTGGAYMDFPRVHRLPN